MKRLIIILFMFINSMHGIAQVEYKSMYVPMDISGMKNALDRKQAAYDHNKKYIDNLIDWIFDLKSQTSDVTFRNALDRNYRKLQSFDGTDLSLLDAEIRNIELSIKDEIDKYNLRIRESSDPSKFWEAGNTDLNKKQYQSAIDNYNKVEQLSPNFSGTFLNRGFAYQNLNNYGSALDDYSKFISIESNNPNGYIYRAWLYYGHKEFTKAIIDFDSFIRLDPKKQDGYSGRGWSKYYQEDYIGALQDFNKQIEFDSNSAMAYYNRGAAKSQLKDYYGSTEDYEKSISIDPSFSMAYNNLAWDKFNQKKYKEALPYVDKAIEIDNKNSAAYDTRFEIKFALNDYDGCIKDCLALLELDNKQSNAYFILGRAYYRKGLKEKACISWSKAGENGKKEAYEYISKYCNN